MLFHTWLTVRGKCVDLSALTPGGGMPAVGGFATSARLIESLAGYLPDGRRTQGFAEVARPKPPLIIP